MADGRPVLRAAFTAAELARATGGTWHGEAATTGLSVDSREVRPGHLFVALAGERFDGHDFIADVENAGAAAVVVSRDVETSRPRLVVDDTLAALQALAAFHRRRFDLPVIGLTGSNGKTTTKEMIAAVLAPLGPVHKTFGNLNNHIGVPLTLLGLDAGHRAAVVEMGMNHPGEIRLLAGLAAPSTAVITNAGRAHLEGLGSREAVAEAKSEISERLTDADTLIFFGDDPLLAEKNRDRPCRRITFGLDSSVDVQVREIVERGLDGTEFSAAGFGRVVLPIPGRHNVLNAAAALAVSRALGVTPAAAVAALRECRPARGRMDIRRIDGWTVIDDTYNANPDSMRAALDLLRETPHEGRRLAVLGEMFELGRTSTAMHREVGAAASFVDRLFLIGPSAAETGEASLTAGLDPERLVVAADHDDLMRQLLAGLVDGDLILLKGSRGMALEKIVQGLEAAVAGAGKGQ